MQKILKIIKCELIIKLELADILSPTLYFFIAFNVITISKKFMLEQYGNMA